jgi:hypothetical protein
MIVDDLFEELSLDPLPTNHTRSNRESRDEYSWHRDITNPPPKDPNEVEEWGLIDKIGKVIRRELSRRAATALQSRPDLIKKYGVLRPRRLS